MKNKIVDSHCHLDFDDYSNDLDTVIRNAKLNDVEYLLSISVNLEKFKTIHNITKKYKNIWCTTGIHPNNVQKNISDDQFESIIKQLKENINKPKVIGLGETGLDYFRESNNKINQIKLFEGPLEISSLTNKPVIVHTRKAESDTISILNNFTKKKNVRGLIHCFTSTKEMAEAALNVGFYISLSGVITFRNAKDLVDIVKYIPTDKLLVETDSPYLSPVPNRGKRNEPSNTKFTLEKLAEIKSISVENMAKITTDNFFSLFKEI